MARFPRHVPLSRLKGATPDKGCRFTPIAFSQVRHLGQEKNRGVRTDSDRGQFLCFGGELFVVLDELLHQQIELRDLSFDLLDQALAQLEQSLLVELSAAILLSHEQTA